MEVVPGKKVLDFSGRMVHNEGYPLGGANRICCKSHKGSKKKQSPEKLAAARGMRASVGE